MYNIEDYYFDEQSKEVMLELLGTNNKYFSMSKQAFKFGHKEFGWNLFNNGTAAQITTFIQSMEYMCQDYLNQLNDVLVKLEK